MSAVIDPRADPRSESLRGPALGSRDAVDAIFVLVLTGIALFGFRTTYSGHQYLISGVVAGAIGIGVATVVTALRRSIAWTALLVLVAYFLFGGVLVFRSEAIGGVVPNWTVVRDLATVTGDGWRRLLTTLPPVAGTGRLLAIPYLLGLLSGALGAGIAQRTRLRFLPALVPALVLAAVILLGTARPSAELRQGLVFGLVVVAWAAIRRSGARRLSLRSVPGTATRLGLAVVVLAVAGVGAALLGPNLPGHGTNRVVLRTYVTPPFDVAAYASPLVGFRKYTKNANLLYSQTLFTTKGLTAGTPVRLATLDDYDGSVWGATNGTVPAGPGQPLDAFQRVGSRITSDATGKRVHATVTIKSAYADAQDIDAWVPTVGTLDSIRFDGSAAGSHEEAFRYNLATGTGVVADRLAAGDTYTVSGTAGAATLPRDAAPYGAPTLDPSLDSFVASRANQWSAKVDGTIAQALAVARYMHDHGAYSDGGPGEGQYLPGHSLARLTTFLNAAQLVGDDEQYAAAYALICNYLGLPARVVLLAEPEADGAVEGKDVHTAVEVHIRHGATAEWAMIPRSQFMPAPTKKPNKQPPQTIQKANAAVVPPPNPVHPPGTLGQPDRPDQNTQHLAKTAPKNHPALSGFSLVLILYIGVPLLAVLLVCLVIIGIKWRRRRRRRTRGSIPNRFDAGWRELVDWARDLGATVPGRTRNEQALSLAQRPAGQPATALAGRADAGVFGPGIAPEAVLESYWRDIDAARRALGLGAGFFARVRGALNLRSLRRPTKPVRVT